jgi:hypothetical protein
MCLVTWPAKPIGAGISPGPSLSRGDGAMVSEASLSQVCPGADRAWTTRYPEAMMPRVPVRDTKHRS